MSFDLPGTESLESSYSYREERENNLSSSSYQLYFQHQLALKYSS